MQIGRFTATSGMATSQRLSLILWGNAGVGKTVWANTAPGRRLIINFDPDGASSLTPSDDQIILDLSTQPNTIVKEFTLTSSPMIVAIEKLLVDNPDIMTVIVDSTTMFSERTVHYAVNEGRAPGATFDNPGPAAYGVRNRYTNALFTNMLAVTKRYNRHVIFICHEDAPAKGSDDPVTTLLLGGGLKEEVPLKISEVWNMIDNGKKRSIVVRSTPLRKPMKTRMFDARTRIEFTCDYDQYTGKGVTLESLYNKWADGGFAKIELPT